MYQTLSQIIDNCLASSEQDISVYGDPCGGSISAQTLRDILLGSERVKRALDRICSTKVLRINDGELVTYSLDEQKLMNVLNEKHQHLRQHLSRSYFRSLTPKRQKQALKKGGAGVVKNERRFKKEEPEEEEESKSFFEDGGAVYESMF